MKKGDSEHGEGELHHAPGCIPQKGVGSRRVGFRYLTKWLVFVTVLLHAGVLLAGTCEQWAAQVASVQGSVEVQRAGEGQWRPVKLNDTCCPGDTVRINENSRADLALANQPVLRLDQNTTITLGGPQTEETSLTGMLKGAACIDLIKGAVHFFSRISRNLEIRTAFVNAGVEGTEFFIRVSDSQAFISVFDGKVRAVNANGQVALTSGQAAVAEAGKAPVRQFVVKPRDAVRWALYYPPIIYAGAEAGQVQDDVLNPRFLINRAAAMLAVGRVDEAENDISQALRLDPGNSDGCALQAVIAVVLSNKEKAFASARQAIATGPGSATAQIALSYAQQASFDLEGARTSLEQAVKLEPDNALAWARLAEIRSSFGEQDSALAAARQAEGLQPDLSRTKTVLGFAYLLQVDTAEAGKAFAEAIELDQADPLPRLGLGLAKIREGDLEDGRRELEIAASLDPNNSIIRSYLGKTYYEEKRANLDSLEFDNAKALDPRDPTPWLYSAIRKQTINEPVGALHDLETAMALNDNRAVYRSRLLLDADLAARSASLARIYSDLGFQQVALAKGYSAVNTDPSDSSAHRFLSDSYAALPRHEIARVSELLQSQMLQSSNITPIQPQLAESSLFLISSEGPGSLSFSEFNPLFNRDRVALQASGMAGGNNTFGSEGIISGINKKASFSIGYTHFQTDGFRINNDQMDNIANIFGQLELTPATSVQAEFRNRNNKRGDVQLRFFADDFLPNLRQQDDTDAMRLGFKHVFSPSSILLGSFIYKNAEYRTDYDNIDDDLFWREISNWPIDENATGSELQHIFRSNKVKAVSGLGYFRINRENKIYDIYYDITFQPPSFLFDWFHLEKSDINHINLYHYSNVSLIKNLIFTVGASVDFLHNETDIVDNLIGSSNQNQKENQFNPKFGITWNPAVDTTIRLATFRTLKRTMVTDQTLEPTQVAGFNQFFDDDNATSAWCYGGAVDQKFSNNIYGGVEFSMRDLAVPNPTQSGISYGDPSWSFPTIDMEEYFRRAYLYWTPQEWLAMRMEYQYEEFSRDPQVLPDGTVIYEEFKQVRTHRVPLGINFFHSSGLSAGLKATYYDQDGDFTRQNETDLTSGSDRFWLVDAALSYRLPLRMGLITAGAKNLFDKHFQYLDTDWRNPAIQPGRFIFGRVTLAMP